MKIRKAVIPAAGRGTRFLPATKVVPKEMLPIVDTPAIQYVVEEAAMFGLSSILVVTGRGKDAIIDHFDSAPELEEDLRIRGDALKLQRTRHSSMMAHMSFTRQSSPLGLGHAVAHAEEYTGDEHFAVLLGDDILGVSSQTLGRMVSVAEQTGGMVVAVMKVPKSQISKYGCVELRAGIGDLGFGVVASIVEKPKPEDAPSDYAVIGRYVLGPKIYEAIAESGLGVGGEIQLTDALERVAADPERYGQLYAVELDGERYDVGDKTSWLKANVEMGLKSSDIDDTFLPWLSGVVEDLRWQS